MTVALTPMELLAKEIGILDEKRKSMDASIKASEARLKDIRAQFDVAAIKAKQDLDNLQIEQARRMADLRTLVAPLQGQVEALRYQVAREQQRLEAVEVERQHALDERRSQLAVLDASIKTKQDALVSVMGDLASLKAKVGAL